MQDLTTFQGFALNDCLVELSSILDVYCRPVIVSFTNISSNTLLAGLINDMRDEPLIGIAVDSERKPDDSSTDALGRVLEKNVFSLSARAVLADVEFGADPDAGAGNPGSGD